jgi:hypothetical protein
VTLALPKAGLLLADGPKHSGEIWVADIGIPTEVYQAIGVQLATNPFADKDQVRL